MTPNKNYDYTEMYVTMFKFCQILLKCLATLKCRLVVIYEVQNKTQSIKLIIKKTLKIVEHLRTTSSI